jgi:glycosyltransferase involved in cell wall biosynthesis
MNKRPERLLALTHDAGRTGAPIGFLAFLQWWGAQSGRPVHTIVGAHGPLVPDFQKLGPCKIVRPGWMQRNPIGRRLARHLPAWLVARRAGLTRFVDNAAPDVIYANTLTHGSLLESLAGSGRRIVSHAHELGYWINRAGPANLASVIRHSHHFIAAAEAVRDHLVSRHGIPGEKITVVHEHIASVPPAGDRDHRARLRRQLGIAGDTLIIGGCGAEYWRKGRDLIPQLLVALRRALPERKLLFLWIGQGGTPEEEYRLQHDLSQAGMQDCYRTTGELADPHPIYGAMDVFTLLSREDPFPLACLEAAGSGLPVICFAGGGGMPEFVRGGCGYAAPYLDLPAMAQMIATLDRQPQHAAQVGTAARRKVIQNHTIASTGPRILAALAGSAGHSMFAGIDQGGSTRQEAASPGPHAISALNS